MKQVVFILLLTAICLSCFGCSDLNDVSLPSTDISENYGVSDSDAQDPTTDYLAAESLVRQITDSTGRKVEVPNNVKKNCTARKYSADDYISWSSNKCGRNR